MPSHLSTIEPGRIPTELVHLLLHSAWSVLGAFQDRFEWIDVECLKTRSRAIETYKSWCVFCVIKLPSMRPGSPLRCSYCCWLAIRYVLPRTCGKAARGHWQVCVIILVLTWNNMCTPIGEFCKVDSKTSNSPHL